MLREVARIQSARRPTEQAHCAGFVGKPAGIAGDVVAVHPDQLERIARIVDRALGQCPGALVDQPDIGAIDEKHADARIGAPQALLPRHRL